MTTTGRDLEKIMIAGIGGASLGTELAKCLTLAGVYDIYGCDISPTAFGLYQDIFSGTYLIDRDDYISSVIRACHDSGCRWLIAGGEAPMRLLAEAATRLADENIGLAANHPDVVRVFSDKAATFELLGRLGVPIPKTCSVRVPDDIAEVGLPCIIKPATGSGGSVFVFFAVDRDEAWLYADYIRRIGGEPLAQEYLGIDEGEFTIGVLSSPDGDVISSIGLRRSLDNKLSVLSNARGGVVSSGYTQGFVADFQDVCRQAEQIACAAGSRGPMNIQGRMRNGVLVPFEINPRFSASSYLRAMAGRNEVHLFLSYLMTGQTPSLGAIQEGWYLRSFDERYVAPMELRR